MFIPRFCCQEGWSGTDCDQCATGYFGPDCAPCTCQEGSCNQGLTGDGPCTACNPGYFGSTCELGSCIYGPMNDGLEGDGTCNGNCTNNHRGTDCAECYSNDSVYGHDCSSFYGEMADKAGNKYKTVKIGDQTWMAENIRYSASGITCKYKDNVTDYGCYYTFANAQKVCPSGWHLPTAADFQELFDYVEKNHQAPSAFLALIAHSDKWTQYPNKGWDEFGFSALPGGGENGNNSYVLLGVRAVFWTATKSGSTTGYYVDLSYNSIQNSTSHIDTSYPVRCIKD